MKPPIAIIGIGELGGVFARGFLRLGHPVYPVTRAIPMVAVAEAILAPELVLVAIVEATYRRCSRPFPTTPGAAVSAYSRTSSCPTTGRAFPDSP